ncbi:MAG: choice-of-anchor D domain-containing protein [Ignavibacteriaceae bacterium]|nr:choice-of-anchor D domain-containing protein [Ignavibacteriaceae bacterium]
MKRLFLLIVLAPVCFSIYSQTLISSYSFPRFTPYDYFWGITEVNDTFWIGTDYSTTSGIYTYNRLYKVTKAGTILDSVSIPFKSHHGAVWDGENFWTAEGYRAQGSRIYKMTRQGVLIDSFYVSQVIGGIPVGIGDVTLDGNILWFTVFSPDFVNYPNSYAYAFDVNTKQLVDTLPLYGRQPLGIAIKGDTMFYVNENQYSNETERIWAVNKHTGDSLFTFPAPDPDGTCNPKGLHWDGGHLWLVAERIGTSSWIYKTIYKYAITGSGSPVITTSTNTLYFGNTIIGTSSNQSITINNIGTAALILSGTEFTSSYFTFSQQQFPDTIAPGNSKQFSVNFNPQQFGEINAVLKIFSNDGGTPVKSIALNGRGIYNGSYIHTSNSVYNFGPRRVNSSNGWIFSVENKGSLPLEITSAMLSNPAFRFDTLLGTTPIVIDTQKTRNLRVWFYPQTNSQYQDTLVLISNAVNNPQLKIPVSGSGDITPPDLGAKVWESIVPDNPTAYTQDYKPMSMKIIPDVNSDGRDDIILATRNYLTLCLNGNSSVTGDIIWSFNTGYNNNNTGAVMFEDALQIRTDIDGDGVRDVVLGCGGGNEFVYTISGRTGRLIWAYGDSVNYENGDINGLRADKDYNNDGIVDVLVSASGSSAGGRHAAICLNGLTGQEIFNKPQTGMFTFDITTLPNGGAICADLSNGGPYYIRGFNMAGNELWATPVADVIWNMKPIQDINGDGTPDFTAFCGGVNPRMIGLSSATGSILWQTTYPNYATFSTVRVISDLNKDGFNDIIFSGKEGVFRLDSKTGGTVWQNTLDQTYVFSTDEIGDLNSDGVPEITAGTRNSVYYILNGANGSILKQETLGAFNDYSVEKIIGLSSVDGNYSTEYVVGTRDGRIICYSGGPAGPVPVELASFTATEESGKIKLTWITTSELNNKEFLIERNGRRIAAIKGNGTSTEKNTYTYYDEVKTASENLVYRLYQTDYDGSPKLIGETEYQFTEQEFTAGLDQNYPNPVNSYATIKYRVPGRKTEGKASRVILTLYDPLGKKVKTIFNKEQLPGQYEFIFNGTDLPSGIYFYELTVGELHFTKKLTIIK